MNEYDTRRGVRLLYVHGFDDPLQQTSHIGANREGTMVSAKHALRPFQRHVQMEQRGKNRTETCGSAVLPWF